MEKIPFYSGFVQIGPNKTLILGGKFSSISSNIDKCFNFDFGNNVFNEDQDYHLPNREVFNGKRFYDLGNGLYGEFSCVTYNTFYLINTTSKTIGTIQ